MKPVRARTLEHSEKDLHHRAQVNLSARDVNKLKRNPIENQRISGFSGQKSDTRK